MEVQLNIDFNKMSNFELRDFIDEQVHNINYLERSQSELRLALELEPQDEDFELAFLENVRTLASKNALIVMAKDKLREIDLAFALEETCEQQLLIDMSANNGNDISPLRRRANHNSHISQSTSRFAEDAVPEHSSDDGMFL
jgi:hypothetical protein